MTIFIESRASEIQIANAVRLLTCECIDDTMFVLRVAVSRGGRSIYIR